MSKESDLVKKLRTLIEERERTIQANKRQMKENLKQYKNNLELDRKLKDECRTLKETIYNILRKNNTRTTHFRNKTSKNVADNREFDIVTLDEEQDS
ncbi:MAG TPA: hypothetical protein DCM10_11845 [Xanthomarina gelatinilytica]|nr:hypothetical protein [Xanthomarina gelatinilytica]|tara:strand:- start:997 stop:1287 length:291 start_codon:yes stop_codon:yes gene_type:complete